MPSLLQQYYKHDILSRHNSYWYGLLNAQPFYHKRVYKDSQLLYCMVYGHPHLYLYSIGYQDSVLYSMDIFRKDLTGIGVTQFEEKGNNQV